MEKPKPLRQKKNERANTSLTGFSVNYESTADDDDFGKSSVTTVRVHVLKNRVDRLALRRHVGLLLVDFSIGTWEQNTHILYFSPVFLVKSQYGGHSGLFIE